MSRVVYHYAVGQVPTRHMVPAGSQIVGAAMRRGQPVVYVERLVNPADPEAHPMDVVFVGTGQPFDAWGLKHIATLKDGDLVWHVYGRIDYDWRKPHG